MKMRVKSLVFLLVAIILIGGCENLAKEIMLSIKIMKQAEAAAVFPPCPKDAPYRIGAFLTGPCVDKEGLAEYIDIRIKGTSPDEEKNFILTTKAVLLGQKKNCPSDKPYFISSFIFFGKCLSKTEFSQHLEGEVKDWQDLEAEQGKERFLVDTSYCNKGELYDTHNHLCIVTSSCSNYPNMYFNKVIGNCDCVEGYRMTTEGCEKEIEKECEYDNECGTIKCSGKYKLMPRCDTRTYKCYEEKVDCTEFFGEKAVCVNGLCKAS